MIRPCAAAVLFASLPIPAWADALQDRLVAGARATDTSGHAFRETLTTAGTGVGNHRYLTAYDPRRDPADRWQLVSVDGRTPTPAETAKARKAKRAPVPTYAELAKWIGGPATRVDGPSGTVIYRFARLPAGTIRIGSHDASADTAAELVVAGGSAPFVERIHFASTKGFRMMLVASVRSMAFTSRYHRLPDGQVAAADITSTIAGSMMGKSGEIRTSASYTDWQKVR